MALSRRDFLKFAVRSTGLLAATSAGGLAYTMVIEPHAVQVREVEVQPRGLPPAFDGLRIAHITDLHMGSWTTADHLAHVVKMIHDRKPDVVAITGDFVTHIYSQTLNDLVRGLSDLRAESGVYAVLGNHDHWTDAVAVSAAVERAGITLLTNRHIPIRRGGETLYIAGVDDIWEGLHDLDAALDGIPAEGCVVLLAHEPDYADAVNADGRVAMQLSGHSHGGQVRLPFIGAPVLPYLGTKYDLGRYDLDNLMLYVNPGIGMLDLSVRFGCPPEISVFTLQA